MADGDLKADIINGAYSKMRISGLTVSATPEDVSLALERLEDMAAEFDGRNISTNYNFEDEPDTGSTHNLDRKFWDAFKSNLAVRLFPDFGKGMQPDPVLIAQAQQGFSFLSATTAPRRQTQYPSRMPRGSGSTWLNRWNRYFQPVEEVPLSSASVKMVVGDIEDFVEHFDSWLKDVEDVVSYTIEAGSGLTIVSDSLDTPDVLYRVQADGTPSVTGGGSICIKIVATTDTGRVTTRVINFEVKESAEV
jgi:hypothetical protein